MTPKSKHQLLLQVKLDLGSRPDYNLQITNHFRHKEIPLYMYTVHVYPKFTENGNCSQ